MVNLLTGILVLTPLIAGSAQIGNLKNWKYFLTDFAIRKDRPLLLFTADFEDLYWRSWIRSVVPVVARKTAVPFSVLHVNRAPCNVTERPTPCTRGRGKGGFNLASLRRLKATQRPFYIVSSFRTNVETGFVSQIFLDEHLRQLRLLLVAVPESMEDLLASTYFPHLNQALLATLDLKKNTIRVWEAFQLDIDSPSNVAEIGLWTPSTPRVGGGSTPCGPPNGLLHLNEEDNVERRSDLMGKELRCVTLENPPTTVFRITDGVIEYKGSYFDIIDTIKAMANFTYTCFHPEDGEWGTLKKTGWTGIVREISEGNADIAIASLDHTAERSSVVDFTFGISNVGYHMVISRPSKLDITWSTYVMEMSTQSWIVTMFTFFVFVMFLPLITKCSPKEKVTLSATDAVLMVIGSISTNANPHPITTTSCRIAFLTVYFSTFLLLTHYTAFLTSSLTVTSNRLPFTTLQGMVQNEHYDFGFAYGTSLEDQFQKSSHPLYSQVWQKYIKDREHLLPKSDHEGINFAKTKSYVYLTGMTGFNYMFGQDCDLLHLDETYMEVSTAFIVQKRSPLKDVINYYLQKMREKGLIVKILKQWAPYPAVCSTPNTISIPGLSSVLTVFIFLALFIFVSLVFLVGERVFYVAK